VKYEYDIQDSINSMKKTSLKMLWLKRLPVYIFRKDALDFRLCYKHVTIVLKTKVLQLIVDLFAFVYCWRFLLLIRPLYENCK
jgi:hypothetical protein